MRQFLNLASTLTFLVAFASPASADVTGTWEITINSPQGTSNVKATLKQEGERLNGVFKGQRGELAFEGTVKENEIKFSYTIKFQGTDLLITMTGKIEGDLIKGDADFGGLAQGEWTGRRILETAGATVTSTASGPVTAASSGIEGDWDVTINSPQGQRNVRANFKEEGEKLSGVFKGERGELAFEGTLKGKEIKFSYSIKFQGTDLPITMTGEIEGDSIKGTADFGGFAQDNWTARRAVAPSTAVDKTPASTAPSTDMIDVTGTWAFEVETAAGSGAPTFTFKQDGENLTGQYKGIFGEATIAGTVKGKEISFSFKVSAQGIEGTVKYTGTIEDKNSMKGSVTLGDLGSGTWTGKRQ